MGTEGDLIKEHGQATDAITKALKPLEESMGSYTAGDDATMRDMAKTGTAKAAAERDDT